MEEITASIALGDEGANELPRRLLLDLIDQDCGWAIAAAFNGIAAAAQVGEWLRKLERESVEKN